MTWLMHLVSDLGTPAFYLSVLCIAIMLMLEIAYGIEHLIKFGVWG